MTRIQNDGSVPMEVFETGAKRDSKEGKGRYDLLPYHAILRLALHYEAGAKHYGDHNWRKGMKMSIYLSSLLRHAFKYQAGDRSEDHLAAIMWNAAALIDHEERIANDILPDDLNDLAQANQSFPDFHLQLVQS